MRDFEKRVGNVQALVGAMLPAEYLSFLLQGPPTFARAVGVPFRGELWNLIYFFELSLGPEHRQLDVTCRLVSDVLPPFALPIASDHAGNFFCLFLQGPLKGQVAWWNHERELGDHNTEPVATSLEAFLSSIEEFRPNDA
jgi:hypothetical protein